MALLAVDCPRAADLALHIPSVRRLCAVAMVRCVTWAWQQSHPSGHGASEWPTVAPATVLRDDVTAPGAALQRIQSRCRGRCKASGPLRSFHSIPLDQHCLVALNFLSAFYFP